MIKAKDSMVEIEGSQPELMSEFVCIVRSLKKHGVLDTKDIDYVNKLTDMSSEELDKEVEKAKARFVTRLGSFQNMLDEMIKECKKHEDKGDA